MFRILTLALVAASLGCNGGNDGPVDGGDSGPAGDAANGDASGDAPSCAGGTWIEEVTGSVVDEGGTPLAGTRPQLCIRKAPSGQLICLVPPTTDATGEFTITVSGDLRCMENAAFRILLPGADMATTYCDVPMTPVAGAVALSSPYVLFATTAATGLPASGDGTVERTVTFADGMQLDVIPDNFFGGSGTGYDILAARRVAPDTTGLCFIADPATLESVYGFSPEGDITPGAFPIRFPNATTLAAATPVKLYVLGGLDCTLVDGTHVPESQWQQYGTGAVSSDGTTVEGDPVPCLTWVGYGL